MVARLQDAGPAFGTARPPHGACAGDEGGVVTLRAEDAAAQPRAAAPRARGMTIGEAAQRSGVSAKMIRHYEAIGLLEAERRANGYRSYGPHQVSVLRFIRHARDLAFPLEDIRRLLTLWGDRSRSSAEVKRLALAHVEALEAKAASLNAMAESLRHLAQHCAGDDRPDCPILAELEGKPA